MTHRFVCLAPFMLLPFLSTSAGAGAWPLPAGESKWVLSTEYTLATHLFDAKGNLVLAPRYEVLRDSLYGEYGVTDTLTVIGQAAFERRTIGAPIFSSFTGLGYTELGGRWRVWEGYNAVFSVQSTGRIAGSREADNPVEIGHTGWEADARALIGYSFSLFRRHFFADVQGGYRARFGDPADELRLDATFGVHMSRRLMVLAQSFSQWSVGTPMRGFVDSEDHKIQMSGVLNLTQRWAIQAGSRTTLMGKNTWQEQTYFGGLWLKF